MIDLSLRFDIRFACWLGVGVAVAITAVETTRRMAASLLWNRRSSAREAPTGLAGAGRTAPARLREVTRCSVVGRARLCRAGLPNPLSNRGIARVQEAGARLARH